jgi:hypothetical protein
VIRRKYSIDRSAAHADAIVTNSKPYDAMRGNDAFTINAVGAAQLPALPCCSTGAPPALAFA